MGVATVAVCLATGLGEAPAAVICFGFCAFTTTTITQEFVRGVAIRKRNTGQDAVSALMGMVLRGKRRYGGYIVHVGIVLMFLGFAGTAYKKETDIKLVPGAQTTIGKYTIRFDRLAHEEDRQKEMVTGEVTALVDGKVIDHLRPAKWFFHKHESEPTTEVAIRRAPAEDLYITLGNYDLAEGNVTLKVVVNPVVDWIWFGFMLLAIGTGITLMPEAVLERLTASATAGAEAASRSAGAAERRALAGARGRGPRPRPRRSPAAAQMPGGVAGAAEPGGPRRELAGAQHHLPVRDLPAQPARLRVGELRPRQRQDRIDDPRSCSTRDGRAIRSSSTSSRSTAGRWRWRRRSTRASTAWRGCSRTALGAVAAGGLGYAAYRLSRRPRGTTAARRRARRRPRRTGGGQPSSPTSSTTS